MQKNIRLIDFNEDISRGCIFRCKGKFPYEAYVDFMVIEALHEDCRRYALLVNSGYKAGITRQILPEESKPSNNEGYAIDLKWLKLNWNKWIYPDCPLDEVYIVFREIPVDFLSP